MTLFLFSDKFGHENCVNLRIYKTFIFGDDG